MLYFVCNCFYSIARCSSEWKVQYLIKAPEGDAADHDGGVQADACEETSALQCHIWAAAY